MRFRFHRLDGVAELSAAELLLVGVELSAAELLAVVVELSTLVELFGVNGSTLVELSAEIVLFTSVVLLLMNGVVELLRSGDVVVLEVDTSAAHAAGESIRLFLYVSKSLQDHDHFLSCL